jgi:cyclophilin family peptidyl-prolyl cis-trans isomerase
LFFITLGPNISIDRDRHTIFGKVVGETIYNLIKVTESDWGALLNVR